MSKSSNINVSGDIQPSRSRTAEIVLGILGGIFGIIAGFIGSLLGGVATALGAGDGGLSSQGLGCAAVSFAAILLVFFINRNHKLMGWLLIVSGILNFVFVGLVGILSGLLIIIAGVLALRK